MFSKIIAFLIVTAVICKADTCFSESDFSNILTLGFHLDSSLISLNDTIENSKNDVLNFARTKYNELNPVINNFNETMYFLKDTYNSFLPIIINFNNTLTFIRSVYSNDLNETINNIPTYISLAKHNLNKIESKITIKYIAIASLAFFGTGTFSIMTIVTIFVIIIKRINRQTSNAYVAMESFP